MKHGSLFSGIGGFDLAAEWMGWDNVFHCEWNPFGQKVLKYYWPESECFNDITKTDFTRYANKIDIISGGFPCQPYSAAGKRKGKEDERHLWPEMLRAIREIRPRWVVGENVLGLVNWSGGLVFHEVQADLEAEGYKVFPFLLPAAAVNAPHRRDRIWFVAYSQSVLWNGGIGKHRQEIDKNKSRFCKCGQKQCQMGCELERYSKEWNATDTSIFGQKCGEKREFSEKKPQSNDKQLKRRDELFRTNFQMFPTQSPICSGDDGLPSQLDGITFSKWRAESIKGYGNAIVPQVVYQIFKSIQEYEQLQKM